MKRMILASLLIVISVATLQATPLTVFSGAALNAAGLTPVRDSFRNAIGGGVAEPKGGYCHHFASAVVHSTSRQGKRRDALVPPPLSDREFVRTRGACASRLLASPTKRYA